MTTLERRLTVGTLAQQGAQVVAVVVMLGVVTSLGRSLTLAEFGVYGLVSTFSSYLLFALGSAESAVIRDLAAAATPADRSRVFTSALCIYGALGLLAAAAIAGFGTLLLAAFDIPEALMHEARLGVLAVAVVTAIGWPIKLFQDTLRGMQRYKAASVAEAGGYVGFGVALAVLVATGAPLWALIAVGGGIPLFIGLSAVVVSAALRTLVRIDPRSVRRAELLSLLRFAWSMLLIASSDVVASSLDRTILALFRPAATVGLYEGASRPNTLIRQLNSSFGTILFPAASLLIAEQDVVRIRELLVRGARYMLAIVVPPTLTLIVLGDDILTTWLGAKFGAAHLALAIFVSAWLVVPNATIPGTLMVLRGETRRRIVLSWSVALVNLALSLALTPWLGLTGVVLGTTVASVVVIPFFAVPEMRHWRVSARELAREAWVPVYGLALGLLALLLAARWLLPMDHALVVLAVCVAACLAYWVAFYAVALTPSERQLVRGVAWPRSG
jgi:O-antigen/teichoic acid export membrane protein